MKLKDMSGNKYLHEMQDYCLTVPGTILHRLEKPVILNKNLSLTFFLEGKYIAIIIFFLQVESDELNIRNSVFYNLFIKSPKIWSLLGEYLANLLGS